MNVSLYVLLFGAVIIGITALVVAIKSDKGWGPYSMRIISVAIVVTVATFLVTLDIPEKSLTTPFTFFGLVVGYLFGKST